MSSPERTELLVLPGVLTADQAAQTIRGLLAVQRSGGAIPWFRGHHLDPWDHTEAAMALDVAGEHEAAERAYDWLGRHQNDDGSWYAAYQDGDAGDVTDRGRESNFVAYVAVGVWHHYCRRGTRRSSTGCGRRCGRPSSGCSLQQPGGQIGWKREADGTRRRRAALTGSSSIHHALGCALAIADAVESRSDWELALGARGHAIRRHPERFLDKNRHY